MTLQDIINDKSQLFHLANIKSALLSGMYYKVYALRSLNWRKVLDDIPVEDAIKRIEKHVS